jgi:NAD(P)H-hydrate epimerase
MKLATAAEVRDLDRRATEEYGVPSLLLMENAGIALANQADRMLNGVEDRQIVIICGKGNNGGDGFCCARHLDERGANVTVFCLAEPEDYRGDAKTNLDILMKRGYSGPANPPESRPFIEGEGWPELTSDTCVRIFALREGERAAVAFENKVSEADLLIDCIYGTGLRGDPEERITQLIHLINAMQVPILACDIPSGVIADTGKVPTFAIKAQATVTFGVAKIGLAIHPGASHVGELIIAPISYPPALQHSLPGHTFCLDTQDVALRVIPRPTTGHKGTFGKVATVAGSEGMTGAGALCALSALKTGSGLSYYVIPEGLMSRWGNVPLEIVGRPVPGESHHSDADAILQAVCDCDAVALGPGFGDSPEAVETARRVIEASERPLVIDADALRVFSLSSYLGPKTAKKRLSVLTPHPGEAARIAGVSVGEIEDDRISWAKRLAQSLTCVLLLKGAATLIAEPSGRLCVNTTGTPAMATAGSGDVLTGIILSLLGLGWEPFEAACHAAYIHGLAGEQAERILGPFGVTAGDICHNIPYVMADLFRGNAYL